MSFVESRDMSQLAIRDRLRNPPNAVEDVAIDLKRKVMTGDLPRLEEITSVVCLNYSVTREQLSGPARTEVLVRPRQVAMFLMYTMTNVSFPKIGHLFGGRDHTTALHAVRKIEALVKVDKELSGRVDELRALVRMRVARRHTSIMCIDTREF